MDFMTAAKTGFSKLGDMSGKASRSEFWWYVLAVVIVGIIINVVLQSVLGPILGSAIGQLVGIALLFAATIRRLADAGKPAFWAYIYFGLSALMAVLMLVGMALALPLVGLVSLVLLVLMIYFLVQPSV